MPARGKAASLFKYAETRGNWLRGRDLNPRPSGYEPDELPDCSTPRRWFAFWPIDQNECLEDSRSTRLRNRADTLAWHAVVGANAVGRRGTPCVDGDRAGHHTTDRAGSRGAGRLRPAAGRPAGADRAADR